MAEAHKIWAKEKKIWGHTSPDREKLKKARNVFYCLVRKAKRECWQSFLEGEEDILDPAKIQLEDKNRYWIVLKYTKPRTNSTSPMLIGLNNKKAITMQAKEALVSSHALPRPPIVDGVDSTSLHLALSWASSFPLPHPLYLLQICLVSYSGSAALSAISLLHLIIKSRPG